MKAATKEIDTIDARLRAARATLQLKQEELVVKSGIPLNSLRKYEGGHSVPGGDAIAGLVRAGINANWLLTGEGPMLLADLAPKPPEAPRINADALVQAFCVSLATAPPGETTEQSARKAVQFYIYCLDSGMITPEGVGVGGGKSAA